MRVLTTPALVLLEMEPLTCNLVFTMSKGAQTMLERDPDKPEKREEGGWSRAEQSEEKIAQQSRAMSMHAGGGGGQERAKSKTAIIARC